MTFFEVIGIILLAENKYAEKITSKLHRNIARLQEIFKNSIIYNHASEQSVILID